MEKIETQIIVVVPIGPGIAAANVADTISSFIYYTRADYRIILADDSGQRIGAEVAGQFDSDLIVNEKPMGGWAGLYITLANAYRLALEKYDFKVLLKLDTDALIIGPEPELEAFRLFSSNKYAGIAGQYPLTFQGEPWNIEWPRQRIRNSTRSWKFIRRPLANWLLIRHYQRALKNGYQTGESVFGGAYFMSYGYLKTLWKEGLLPAAVFRSLNLGEDHLFSLLAKAVGYSLESLSGDEGPVACDWKGLPASPAKLVSEKKKIIHSVTSWKEMDESAIREYFRTLRK